MNFKYSSIRVWGGLDWSGWRWRAGGRRGEGMNKTQPLEKEESDKEHSEEPRPVCLFTTLHTGPERDRQRT